MFADKVRKKFVATRRKSCAQGRNRRDVRPSPTDPLWRARELTFPAPAAGFDELCRHCAMSGIGAHMARSMRRVPPARVRSDRACVSGAIATRARPTTQRIPAQTAARPDMTGAKYGSRYASIWFAYGSICFDMVCPNRRFSGKNIVFRSISEAYAKAYEP